MTGLSLGRVAGIRLVLDWTVLFIFLLVVTSLGMGTLPSWHPDWSSALVWATAAAAGVLLLASILAHELAHALVGRAMGMPVRSITLFVFGGITDIEREPASPRAEALMAFVGPATSLVIGVVSLLAASALTPGGLAADQPAETLARMRPLATLLGWLGPINIALAIFNLVPGFPLDGGRILRAGLWAASGSLARATRWASYAGRAVAWALIGIGVLMFLGVQVPFFGVGVGGLWLALIGWFLHTAAVASYRQLLVRDLLEDVPVMRFVRGPGPAPRLDTDLASLVDEYLMPSGARALPVVSEEGALAGIVAVPDIRRVPRAQWPATPAREVMVPFERLVTVSPRDDLFTALQVMSRHGFGQLPVVERGELRGFVVREDIGRWLSLQIQDDVAEPGLSQAPSPRRRVPREPAHDERPRL